MQTDSGLGHTGDLAQAVFIDMFACRTSSTCVLLDTALLRRAELAWACKGACIALSILLDMGQPKETKKRYAATTRS